MSGTIKGKGKAAATAPSLDHKEDEDDDYDDDSGDDVDSDDVEGDDDDGDYPPPPDHPWGGESSGDCGEGASSEPGFVAALRRPPAGETAKSRGNNRKTLEEGRPAQTTKAFARHQKEFK